MSEEEQRKFAALMRLHIPKPTGAEFHALHAFTDYAAAVLRRPVLHWRDLSTDDARTVMKAAMKQYPQK